MGGAVGAFAAAAAMATNSAAPAKADIETLLDPIIQPLVTSLSDAIAGFDPAAATDLTSWTDSLLSSLNSIDLALPAAAGPAAAVAAASTPAEATIPLSLALGTEPTVDVGVNGASGTPMLVDTGSSGLVIPWQDLLGTNLSTLGLPVSYGFSGYSGGVEYFYAQFNTSVDYGGIVSTAGTPVDVELLSWPTAFGSPLNFEQFLADDHVTGILGIGNAASDGGPGVSPLQAAGYNGVLVDIPQKELVLGANTGTPFATISGAPIPNSNLYESINGGTPVAVSNDIDSGGVYGTIPSSLVGNAGSLPSGTVIAVYDHPGGTLLYQYTTGTDSFGNSTAPTAVTGNTIDSGVEPFLQEPIYIDYVNNALVFDKPVP
jgi:PE-PGRS C-terminal aspartyl peptidase-like domain